MAKTFSAQTTYDMSADAAFARHIDDAVLVRKFEALGSREIKVKVDRRGDDEVTFTVDRKVDAEVPGFAKKVMKPTNTVHLVEKWRRTGDGYRCDWTAETSPAPSRLEGTRTLTPAGTGVTDRTDGTVQVKVPLIGGKLAAWLAGEAQKEVESELEWLKQQGG